jgi:cation:H+ antiporter
MVENLFIFFASLFLIIKGATLSTKYSFRIAESYNISKYVVGFFMVAIISIIPETLVSINAALQNVSAMGLGTLFGSNIADLTLIFAVTILFARRSLKIESKILKENVVYPFILLIPIILGIDGFYSRWEGLALVLAGVVFYALSFKKEQRARPAPREVVVISSNKRLDLIYLIIGLVLLLVGSHFIVNSGIEIATMLNLNKAAMGMLFIGLGTTIPELSFCLSAVKSNRDSLAIGDVLGTVLADATIVIGILALVNPFAFPRKIIYIAGLFMVSAAFVLFYLMRTGKSLTRSEAFLLIFFWVLFISTELILNG